MTTLPILQQALSASDGCRRCPLHLGAHRVVPGEGDPNARLLILGEAPGRSEDATGKPFVGSAGELLDRLLSRLPVPVATWHKPSDIGMSVTGNVDPARVEVSFNQPLGRSNGAFITNVCRCRPPMNRTPEPAEMKACAPYFWATLRALPAVRVIVALGNTPLRFLSEDPLARITQRRGQWFDRTLDGRTVRVMPTFHPAYLLRTGPASKEREQVWADMLEVVRVLSESESRP